MLIKTFLEGIVIGIMIGVIIADHIYTKSVTKEMLSREEPPQL